MPVQSSVDPYIHTLQFGIANSPNGMIYGAESKLKNPEETHTDMGNMPRNSEQTVTQA